MECARKAGEKQSWRNHLVALDVTRFIVANHAPERIDSREGAVNSYDKTSVQSRLTNFLEPFYYIPLLNIKYLFEIQLPVRIN